MAIREGAWDCPHCDKGRNRGPEKHCSGCGAPRGLEVQFYLPDDAPEITEAAALARAKAGPDWNCQYCDTDNPADYAFCSSCGASSDGAPPRPVIEHRDEPPPVPKRPAVAVAPPKPPKPKKKKWGCGCSMAGILAFIAALFLGGPTEDVVVVEGHRWTRTVEVQALVTETKEGWEGELPQDARVLSQGRAIHHHNKVQTGTETKARTVSEQVQVGTEKVKVGVRDLGNGYFEDIYEDRPVYENRSRQETYEEPVYRMDPIYRQKYTYQVDRWKKARDAVARGNDDDPSWPATRLGAKEREGTRYEAYEVVFRDSEGRQRAYPVPTEDVWRTFTVGKRFNAEIRGKNKVNKILGPA